MSGNVIVCYEMVEGVKIVNRKSNWDGYWRFANKHPRIDKIRFSIVNYVYRKLMRGVKFNTTPKILEFGAGTGLATLQLLKTTRRCWMFGR